MTDPRPADLTAQGPRTHRLKTVPGPFAAVRSGEKPFEWRLNDRDFRVGDVLVLAEWNPTTEVFTGEEERRVVTYILSGRFGVPDGYCVMGLAAAPSRGQGAGEVVVCRPCVMAEGCEATSKGECPKCGSDDWVYADVLASPAPVASPERCCVNCGKAPDRWPYCGAPECPVKAAPAGPETGWARRCNIEVTDDGLRVCRGEHDKAAGCEWEYFVPRSALSAATERAEKAERELANQRGVSQSWFEKAIASEFRCAAALKLAGEAVGTAKSAASWIEARRDRARYDSAIASLRSRLAALSSPSAPESGTQGVKDG